MQFYKKFLKLVLVSIVFNLNSENSSITYEQQIINRATKYLNLDSKTHDNLYNLASTEQTPIRKLKKYRNRIPLFKKYPKLQKDIAHIQFCNLPTAITKCNKLSDKLDINLYIKRDDQTGKLFGGNKPRKLEFLLADAVKHNARSVLTFGCAGSNHALATTVYAKEVDLESFLMLKPQHNSYVARRNLLLDSFYGAQLNLSPNDHFRAISTVHKLVDHKLTYNSFPYIIPTGGSCPIGCLGFVNAAFELKEQIEAGIIPMPTRIYLALGSTGTTAGLLIGLKAAQLKIKLIGVAVEPEEFPGEFLTKIRELYTETVQLISSVDSSFPTLNLESDDLEIIYDQAGKDYALFTHSGVEAIQLAHEIEDIKLDGVYTGKAFAGLLESLKKEKNQNILFWNTFSGDSYEHLTSQVNYKKLPAYFHSYFETSVQELDIK